MNFLELIAVSRRARHHRYRLHRHQMHRLKWDRLDSGVSVRKRTVANETREEVNGVSGGDLMRELGIRDGRRLGC